MRRGRRSSPRPSPLAAGPQASRDGISSGDIRRELRDFARRQERRRRVVPRALLVGILAGLTASAFRLTLNAAERLRSGLFHFAHGLPAWWGLPLAAAVCGGGAAAALWLVRSFAPETSGSGIPHLKAVLHRLRGMRWRRVLLVKFASGTLASAAAWPWAARDRPCRWAPPSARWCPSGCGATRGSGTP